MEIQSMAELMKDLGFNEKASFEAKKAFLKNLFKQAAIKEAAAKENSSDTKDEFESQDHVQLSLFDIDGVI